MFCHLLFFSFVHIVLHCLLTSLFPGLCIVFFQTVGNQNGKVVPQTYPSLYHMTVQDLSFSFTNYFNNFNILSLVVSILLFFPQSDFSFIYSLLFISSIISISPFPPNHVNVICSSPSIFTDQSFLFI